MIAVDTSAIIAILRLEPEADAFSRRMEEAAAVCMSAVSLQEACMVLAGRHADEMAWSELDRILQDMEVEIIPNTAELARIARDAFIRFGKGRHPARHLDHLPDGQVLSMAAVESGCRERLEDG